MNNESKRLQIEKATIADDEHNEIIKIMTPKEKANHIMKLCRLAVGTPINKKKGWFYVRHAKNSALVVVDEVISVIDPETNFKTWEFYKQVKQEIEKF